HSWVEESRDLLLEVEHPQTGVVDHRVDQGEILDTIQVPAQEVALPVRRAVDGVSRVFGHAQRPWAPVNLRSLSIEQFRGKASHGEEPGDQMRLLGGDGHPLSEEWIQRGPGVADRDEAVGRTGERLEVQAPLRLESMCSYLGAGDGSLDELVKIRDG